MHYIRLTLLWTFVALGSYFAAGCSGAADPSPDADAGALDTCRVFGQGCPDAALADSAPPQDAERDATPDAEQDAGRDAGPRCLELGPAQVERGDACAEGLARSEETIRTEIAGIGVSSCLRYEVYGQGTLVLDARAVSEICEDGSSTTADGIGMRVFTIQDARPQYVDTFIATRTLTRTKLTVSSDDDFVLLCRNGGDASKLNIQLFVTTMCR